MPVLSSTMVLAPTAVQQYFDNNGAFLVGGLLFTYQAGTTTKQNAFTDSTGNTALPDPIVLNARGEVAPSATGTSCGLWLDPTLAYKFVLAPATDTDPPTNPFWTVDNIVSPQAAILAALAQYEASLGGVQIGDIVVTGAATAPNGWLLCYGQAVSRTTYALLFAVIGTAFGDGDASTTFNLPDLRGRYPLGADNMGGSGANRVTQAVSGILATTVGAVGGDQNAQTDTLEAVSVATSVDAGHKHQVGAPITSPLISPGGNASKGIDPDYTTGSTGIGLANISTTVETTVTSALTGSSQNMPPVQVVNYKIFTGVAT